MSTTTSPHRSAPPRPPRGTSRATRAQKPAVEMVDLTIDGIDVSVPKNTLVIRAAEEVGIEIPRFCDHPLLEPVGACRQCLVDVSTPGPDGTLRAMPKPQASCTMTVSPGMQVKTQHSSPVAEKAQNGVMELLLINHPLDCPVCDKGGECPLQNQAMSNGRAVEPLRGRQADLPQADQHLEPGPARPRALRAVRALHPLLRPDRRRPVHRARRAGRPPAGRHLRGEAVRVLLLRQHRPDLPGRRAHRRGLPLPRPPVRPRLHPERLRALRERLLHAHRPPPRLGAAPHGRQRPGGQRGVELRQGPLGLPVRRHPRPPRAPDGPRRRRAAGRVLARGPRGRGRRACGPPPASVCSPVAGCPPRTPTPTRSSPARCSAPTTSTSGPARTRPRRRTSSPPTSSPPARPTARRRRHLRRPRVGEDGRPRGLRARGREPDRLPAPAQGVRAGTRPPCMPSRPSRPAASRRSPVTSSPPPPAPSPRCWTPSARARPAAPPVRVPTPSATPPRRCAARARSSSSASGSRPCPAP